MPTDRRGQSVRSPAPLLACGFDQDAIAILPLFSLRELVVVHVTTRLLADSLKQSVQIFPADQFRFLTLGFAGALFGYTGAQYFSTGRIEPLYFQAKLDDVDFFP